MQTKSSAIALVAPEQLTDAQRQTLQAWQAELEKLVAQRRELHRTKSPTLETHLRSAIENARQCILDTCEARRAELLAEYVAAAGQFYAKPGDALEVARRSDAALALRDFLHGPFTAVSLDGLTRQAEETAGLIERLLAGGELWKFKRHEPAT